MLLTLFCIEIGIGSFFGFSSSSFYVFFLKLIFCFIIQFQFLSCDGGIFRIPPRLSHICNRKWLTKIALGQQPSQHLFSKRSQKQNIASNPMSDVYKENN